MFDNNAGDVVISEFVNILSRMTKLTSEVIEQNKAEPTAMLKDIQTLAKSPCLYNINSGPTQIETLVLFRKKSMVHFH